MSSGSMRRMEALVLSEAERSLLERQTRRSRAPLRLRSVAASSCAAPTG